VAANNEAAAHSLYLAQREQAERQAAEVALCPEARRAHQHLADLYAEEIRRDSPSALLDDDVIGLPRVVILSRD
jgi:hypothetical protein